jgi:hypothetical protein
MNGHELREGATMRRSAEGWQYLCECRLAKGARVRNGRNCTCNPWATMTPSQGEESRER